MTATDAWARFEQAVLAEPDLQADLDGCTTDDDFTTRALDLAHQRSIPLASDDVHTALRQGDRRWIEHGL